MRFPYTIVFVIFTCFIARSQELVPPIQNHTSAEYDGASQNWDIDINEQGIIYSANNQGLLSYDGQRWELFQLQSGSVLRSVLPFKDRIYTGSYQEFGYWSYNDKGEFRYTSLIPLLKDHPFQSEEFWEIISFKDAIYFRSFGAVYKYHNNTIKVIKNLVTNKMTVYDGRLLVSVDTDGLFFLTDNGNLKPLPNQEILNGKRVLDIEVNGKTLYIGTKDGLYTFNGTSVREYHNSQLKKLLTSFELNHLMMFGEDKIILATLRNGILLHDLISGRTAVYNRESGLQNNTVLAMVEKNGKIWLGLDNGIDEIELDSPIQFFTDRTGELGAVYDLTEYNNDLYIASNTGVYRLDDSRVTIVEGSQGHCWKLSAIDNSLFSNHNSGTYKILNDKFIPVEERTGSFQILPSPADSNKLFIGNYTGISIYDKDDESIRELEGLDFPVKKMLFESPSVLWAEHANKGIYRAGINYENFTVSFIDSIDKHNPQKSHKPKIFSINGQIAIFKNNSWFQYNRFKDTLEPFTELKNFRHHDFLLEDENGFWFINKKTNSLAFTNFKDVPLEISSEKLKMRLVKGNENLIKVKDSTYYLTLKDGFAKIKLNNLLASREKVYLSKPIIKGFIDSHGRYSLASVPSIPYNNAKKLTILAGLPDSDANELHYKLLGEQELSGKVQNGILGFQNLAKGDYKLILFGVGPQGETSEISSMNFTVQAPWYFSNLMFVVYILLLAGIIFLIIKLNKRKLHKHRKFLEKKMEEEHEQRLVQLEKKRLQDEIMLKRKELANTTMMAAKKNEVLMDIQGELNKDRDKFSNQYRLKHIMKKINQAIKNKDEWQVFETNFKEVHEDFSKDLLEAYPNLTSKDLKLCSYLKMNLTSKEIAPLMGKSVRGVEVHRYRLRKKMNLDSQENLSNFLIKNF